MRIYKLLLVGKHINILLLAAMIFGCRKHVGMIPNSKQNPNPITTEKEKKREPIVAKNLATKFKSVKEFTVGKHKGIDIELFPTKEADYYQFYICTVDNSNCAPPSNAPKKFYLTAHQFADPPAGKIEIFAASCVSSEKKDDTEEECGKYSKALFYMSQSAESETKSHLKAREEIVEKNRSDCHDFFDNIEEYYNKMKASYSFSQDALLQAVQKQLEMGKELTCELIFSEVYLDLTAQEKPEGIPKSLNNNKLVWTPAAITLVTLGSISASIGTVFIAKAIAKSFALANTQEVQYTEALLEMKQNRIRLEEEMEKSTQKYKLEHNADIERNRIKDEIRDLYNNFAEVIKKGRDALHANKLKIESSIKR